MANLAVPVEDRQGPAVPDLPAQVHQGAAEFAVGQVDADEIAAVVFDPQQEGGFPP